MAQPQRQGFPAVMKDEPQVRVWDLPTRMFHWLLVVLVVGAYATYKWGDVQMRWHVWNGYAVLTLVAFRLIWGLVGSSTARFASFVRGPKAMLDYARGLVAGRPARCLGHNPLGGAMIVVMLLALAAQGGMGLFATDDVLVNGPLRHTVSSATAARLTSLHKLGFWLVVGLAGLHVAAVLLHLLWKGDNLVLPMLTGRKPRAELPADAVPELRPAWTGALALAVAAGLVWGGMQSWPRLADHFKPPAPAKKQDDW